ncbi:lytic transglycosylase domain-containing protein [Magnetospirillum sp. UT-4]|uniref:lytic transglycosylase domain-containing protein n=1 Tax=Magnetospirillum sp. UT-4 TaxID=2681467 RepID=UPI0020C5340F|nr:lytic transglycosylase domain-containing protein [Magnetospirillum sp. UT-4]
MRARSIAVVVAAALAASVAAQAKPPPSAAADRGVVEQVLGAARKDRFAEAERLAMQSKNRVLAKLVRWMTYVSPNSGASFEEIGSFIEASPDWPLMGSLQRRAEEAVTAATPDDRIMAWFTAHPPATVDGGMAFARALLASGNEEKAVKLIRETWAEGGFGVMQERQFLTLYGDYLRPDDHWRRLDRLLWDKQEAPAQRMLLKVSGGRRLLAQARLALQDGKANPEPAIAAVPKEYRDDPGLILDRVRWRRQKDLDEDAIDLLGHPARNAVRPELWWTERAVLARRALQKGLISRAYQVAADHGLEAKALQFADAEFLAGWISLRFLDDRETAMAHFRRLWDSVSTPLSRARAAYWAGRTAEMLKDDKAAREWYSQGARYFTAYYGQLSASRLDDHHWPLPPDPQPSAEDVKRFEGREMVRAIRMMMQAGEREHLRAFFLRLNDVADTPGERALVGRLAAEGGRDDLAVTVARRADRESVFLVGAGWPVPPIARVDEPERALVLALIRQESGFMTDVQSPVGARGLMQLMPATAKNVAKSIKVAFSPKKLDEPDYNVRLGSAYLADMISDFEGSYVLALAAYNAGPSRARRWVKEYGDPRDGAVDVIDWIEMIPFTETRNYVQRVMESVSIYRRKLGRNDGISFENDLKRWARRPQGAG